MSFCWNLLGRGNQLRAEGHMCQEGHRDAVNCSEKKKSNMIEAECLERSSGHALTQPTESY
jgi:hypothetical protein